MAQQTRATTRANNLLISQGRMNRQIQLHSAAWSTAALHALNNPSLPREMLVKKEQSSSHKFFEYLSNHFHRLELPGERWIKYVEHGSHILFAKGESDFQLSFKVVIFSDMKTIISHYGKVLPWMEADIKSEENLVTVLKFLNRLKLPKFL